MHVLLLLVQGAVQAVVSFCKAVSEPQDVALLHGGNTDTLIFPQENGTNDSSKLQEVSVIFISDFQKKKK